MNENFNIYWSLYLGRDILSIMLYLILLKTSGSVNTIKACSDINDIRYRWGLRKIPRDIPLGI